MVDSKDSTVGLNTSRSSLAGRALIQLIRRPQLRILETSISPPNGGGGRVEYLTAEAGKSSRPRVTRPSPLQIGQTGPDKSTYLLAS